MSVAGVPPQHTHDLPKALRVSYRLLLAAVVGLLCAVGTLTYFVYQQQQYVEGRGEYRDAETQRLQQRITDAVCDLLDQLPEGGLLERPRDKYGCGPGIPLSELPEDVRRRYQGEPPAAPASTTPAAAPVPRPPMGAPAAPNLPPRPTPNEPPAGNSPKPEPPPPDPTTGPPSGGAPLAPVTDVVCDLTDVCIKETP